MGIFLPMKHQSSVRHTKILWYVNTCCPQIVLKTIRKLFLIYFKFRPRGWLTWLSSNRPLVITIDCRKSHVGHPVVVICVSLCHNACTVGQINHLSHVTTTTLGWCVSGNNRIVVRVVGWVVLTDKDISLCTMLANNMASTTTMLRSSCLRLGLTTRTTPIMLWLAQRLPMGILTFMSIESRNTAVALVLHLQHSKACQEKTCRLCSINFDVYLEDTCFEMS